MYQVRREIFIAGVARKTEILGTEILDIGTLKNVKFFGTNIVDIENQKNSWYKHC